MGLFYGERKCNRVGGGKRCLSKIKDGNCPCLQNGKIHPPPIIKDQGLCILTLQTLLHPGFCLLVSKSPDYKILFSQGTEKSAKETFLGYKIYPDLKKGGPKLLP